jgi:thiosulfate/3-mercaptopyruvate sulfurtransferase
MKIVFLFFLLLTSCQTIKTKIFQTNSFRVKDEYKEKIELNSQTVVLDARPAFDYSLSHIPGSVNVRWDEFTQHQEPYRGVFESDLYFHARRLARLGITPDTPVIVVGRGQQGGGEEGRVAWTLKYLGVKNVQFVHIDFFERPNSKEEPAPRENAPSWKPELNESLLANKKDMLKLITAKRDANSPLILDVRPEQEYLGKGSSQYSKKAPDIGAINIPWREFINSQGLVNFELKDRLHAVGLTPERKIITISDRGVESALVTMALRQMGYNAANYAGGYSELLAVETKK